MWTRITARGRDTAVTHLIEGGRRRIATIHGDLDMPSSHDKLDGYRDALTAAGLPCDPALEEGGNYSPTFAAAAMRALLERRPDIDGVFAASDTMAAAAFGVIHEAGLRIPEDVAVVGYDGIPVGMTTRPLLTTMRQPIEAMGCEMARLLLERIDQPRGAAPPHHFSHGAYRAPFQRGQGCAAASGAGGGRERCSGVSGAGAPASCTQPTLIKKESQRLFGPEAGQAPPGDEQCQQ